MVGDPWVECIILRGTPMVTMIKEGPTSSNKLKDIESPSSFDVLELEKIRGVDSEVIKNVEVITGVWRPCS